MAEKQAHGSGDSSPPIAGDKIKLHSISEFLMFSERDSQISLDLLGLLSNCAH